MILVKLYTKAHCGLCEEVKEALAGLQATYPHRLEEIDITRERPLHLAYATIIPVVEVGGSRLQAPISRKMLVAALKRAARS